MPPTPFSSPGYQFCTVELSSFYLDVFKDRLYAEVPDDPPPPFVKSNAGFCAVFGNRFVPPSEAYSEKSRMGDDVPRPPAASWGAPPA